ncbi:polysaccharide deacetylase family protein [Bacteroides thetaiotaomicron]|uniref:hypothetical protein n=1 Tax=Bacteroides thetaiotaomicron TaxID=818 RepID=UPI001F350087|nr:hypothetical protein [Bacteroides thetaiotaomicron]MCE8953656.1 hypothetical protein [Bacteroides thetaiotaomicron]MCE8971163.1 hypothetical protein [Bacteroides thetaiotaomicron]
MKKVILTFDYELFFGNNSGTIQKSVIEPTDKILEKLQEINGCAVFFIDYLMIKYLLTENESTQREADLIINQLRKIVAGGSRIELHLHPHWIDAHYTSDGRWDFSNFSHYSLSSLPKSKVTSLFNEGCDFLSGIVQEIEPGYRIKVFRAGGWSILPFEHMQEGFKSSGIFLDSSVIRGSLIEKDGYRVDFREISSADFYRFSENILEEKVAGEFIEVPITKYKLSVFDAILATFDSVLRKNRYRNLADGSHARIGSNKRTLFQKIKMIFDERVFTVNSSSARILKKSILNSNHELIVFSGHPKDFTAATLSNIEVVSEVSMLTTYNKLFCKL